MAQIVLVRRFGADLDDAQLLRLASDPTGCLDLYGVKPIRSYIGADRRTLVCLLEAPDAEAVRTVAQQTPGMIELEVFPATVHEPPPA
jgi:hypothetical protein